MGRLADIVKNPHLPSARARSSLGMGPRAGEPPGAQLVELKDHRGSVAFGWLDEDVLFSRYEGALSSSLGAAFAGKLIELVSRHSGVVYFSDASALTEYDLLARSAFVRAVLSERRKFRSIIFLTWRAGVSQATKTFVDTLGESVTVLTDEDQFSARLLEAAPAGARRLSPAGRRR